MKTTVREIIVLLGERKERSSYYRSERLVIAYALWKASNQASGIRIF